MTTDSAMLAFKRALQHRNSEHDRLAAELDLDELSQVSFLGFSSSITFISTAVFDSS